MLAVPVSVRPLRYDEEAVGSQVIELYGTVTVTAIVSPLVAVLTF